MTHPLVPQGRNWEGEKSLSDIGVFDFIENRKLTGFWKIFSIGLLCFSWPRILKVQVYVSFLVYIVNMNFDFRKKSILAFYSIRMSIRGKTLNVDQINIKLLLYLHKPYPNAHLMKNLNLFKKQNRKVKLRFRFSFKKHLYCKKTFVLSF